MKILASILCSFLLITNINAQLIQLDATLTTNTRVIEDLFGVNGQNIISTDINYAEPFYHNKLSEFYPSTFRYPGGTIANYWNWKKGQFRKSDFDKWPCYWINEGFANSFFEDADLDKLKLLVDRTGTKTNLFLKRSYIR